MDNNIILVSVGIYQEYISENIEQLMKLGFKHIHIITEKKFFKNLNKYSNINLINSELINIDYFNKKSRLDTKTRNGFWNNASKRLFLIYEYMKDKNIQNVIHIENDVLLYNISVVLLFVLLAWFSS